jgi:hypothetical protein
VIARRQLLLAASAAVVAAGVYLAVAVGRGDPPARAPAPPATAGSGSTTTQPPATRPAPSRPGDPPALPAPGSPPAFPPVAKPTVTIVEDPALAASASEERAVADWIAARKNEWITACWPKPTPDRAAPEPTSVRLRAVFEADGRLRAHAFTAAGQREVSRCLNERPFDPPFAGRGQRVDLALTFQFP